MLALVGALACNEPSAAEAYNLALSGSVEVATSLDLCDRAGEQAEECAAAVIRARPEAAGTDCLRIDSPEWRSECFFSIAERRASAGDRFGALAACAGADDYYHECLYHAWMYELQGTLAVSGRAIEGIDRARAPVAYWSQVQTIQGNAEERLWLDWWYVALHRLRPADITECARLETGDRAYCEAGHKQYLQREIAEVIQREGITATLRTRICRGGPATLVELHPDLYVSHPDLDALVPAALEYACAGPRAVGLVPWSPSFMERRPWAAG